MQFCLLNIVIVLMLVLGFIAGSIEHDQEHEHDYEKAVVIWERLATFPARERRCVCRSAHLVLPLRT